MKKIVMLACASIMPFGNISSSYSVNSSTFSEKFINNWVDAFANPFFYMNAVPLGILCYALSKDMNSIEKVSQIDNSAIDNNVTFDDIIGAESAKEALQDVIGYLKNPDQYAQMGAHPSKGILLEGNPGTGKTMLAKAVAKQANANFIAINGSTFSSKYLGDGIERVKSLFKQARKKTPCIIFIDEIDGIGCRSSDNQTVTQENNRIINELLTQIDGITGNHEHPVIIIGATNHKELLDEAFLRSGRFDLAIEVPLPSLQDRIKLIELYSKKIKTDGSINAKKLAELMSDWCAADIANMMNQAALLAVRHNAQATAHQDCLEALKLINDSKKSSDKVASTPINKKQMTKFLKSFYGL